MLRSSILLAKFLFHSFLSIRTKDHFVTVSFTNNSTGTFKEWPSTVYVTTALMSYGSSTCQYTAWSSASLRLRLYGASTTTRSTIVRITDSTNIAKPEFVDGPASPKCRTTGFCICEEIFQIASHISSFSLANETNCVSEDLDAGLFFDTHLSVRLSNATSSFASKKRYMRLCGTYASSVAKSIVDYSTNPQRYIRKYSLQ